MATKSFEFLRLTEIANFTSAEGDSKRYSQNLSRCCTNTVSTNHLRILLLYSRYGCSASNQSFAGPLERQFLLEIVASDRTISCTNAYVVNTFVSKWQECIRMGGWSKNM